ncbi:MAG: c-type cytochrome [Pseudomonadota bacterium]
MRKTASIVPVALAAGACAVQAANVTGDAERGRRIHLGEEQIPGVAACSTCHGADGNATQAPTFPRLAGQYPEYLVYALESYRDGSRKNAVMMPIASALSGEDLRDLAVFYGAQKGDLANLSQVITD